ncbi:MAG: hypothetical protein AAGF12_14720 [Myxococcota bacterium]
MSSLSILLASDVEENTALYAFREESGDQHPDLVVRRAFYAPNTCRRFDDRGWPEGTRIEEWPSRESPIYESGRPCVYQVVRTRYVYDPATDRYVAGRATGLPELDVATPPGREQ